MRARLQLAAKWRTVEQRHRIRVKEQSAAQASLSSLYTAQLNLV
jgi:hypothetical protein